MHLFDFVVAIVERRCEVSGGAASLAAANWSVIYQYDGAASACEQIGGSHAGDPGAYDADVRTQILGERLKLGYFSGVHPDRGRVTRVALHR